jgi:hypothetical protein
MQGGQERAKESQRHVGKTGIQGGMQTGRQVGGAKEGGKQAGQDRKSKASRLQGK